MAGPFAGRPFLSWGEPALSWLSSSVVAGEPAALCMGAYRAARYDALGGSTGPLSNTTGVSSGCDR